MLIAVIAYRPLQYIHINSGNARFWAVDMLPHHPTWIFQYCFFFSFCKATLEAIKGLYDPCIESPVRRQQNPPLIGIQAKASACLCCSLEHVQGNVWPCRNQHGLKVEQRAGQRAELILLGRFLWWWSSLLVLVLSLYEMFFSGLLPTMTVHSIRSEEDDHHIFEITVPSSLLQYLYDPRSSTEAK